MSAESVNSRLDQIQKLDLPKLSEEEKERLQSLEQIVESTFVSAGNALLEIRDSKLYRQTHSTFEEYVRQRWDMTDRRARQLMDSAQVIDNLKTGTTVPLPSSESVVRPLTVLKNPEEQREAYQEAVKASPSGKPTAKHVKAEVQKRKPKLSNINKVKKEPVPEPSPKSVEVPLEPVKTIQPRNQTRGEFVWMQFERWVDQMQAQFPDYTAWMDRQALIDIVNDSYSEEGELVA